MGFIILEVCEEHKNSKLLFCWSAKDLGVVFSPSDQNGIWVLVGEGINSKGTLPKFTIGALERIAKEKRSVIVRVMER